MSWLHSKQRLNRRNMTTSNSISIVVQPVYLKNYYLYVPAKYAGFFPPGKPRTTTPIQLETDAGVFSAQLQYNSRSYV
jgi:hypothetical protein